MAKGLALARVIGLKWPGTADERDGAAETSVETALKADIIDAESVPPADGDDTSAAMVEVLSQALLETTSQSTAVAVGDVRKSVTNDAITAIEADIASLLHSMNAATETDAATDGVLDAEDTTLALLGELDRLWQADPMVGSASAA